MATGPRVIAAFVKIHLAVVDRRPCALGPRLRERLDPQLLDGIEKASRISWIQIGSHVDFTEALFEVAGRDEAREVCKLTVLEALGQSLLRPLFTGALAILGSSFERFVTWTPEAWSALFREVGSLRWVPSDPGSGALVLDGPDPRIAASPAYIEGLAGAFSALFDATRHTGQVTTLASPERIAMRMSWQRDPAPRRP